jgi:hypothetical protein
MTLVCETLITILLIYQEVNFKDIKSGHVPCHFFFYFFPVQISHVKWGLSRFLKIHPKTRIVPHVIIIFFHGFNHSYIYIFILPLVPFTSCLSPLSLSNLY